MELIDLLQEFETRYQNFWKNNQYFVIFATPFSVDINILPENFQIEYIELQSDIELKEKFHNASLLEFYKNYLPKNKCPSFHNHALFIIFWKHLLMQAAIFMNEIHEK